MNNNTILIILCTVEQVFVCVTQVGTWQSLSLITSYLKGYLHIIHSVFGNELVCLYQATLKIYIIRRFTLLKLP